MCVAVYDVRISACPSGTAGAIEAYFTDLAAGGMPGVNLVQELSHELLLVREITAVQTLD